MSEQQIPDVSDPNICAMVLSDHEPREAWTLRGKLIGVYCRTCMHNWPCPSIIAARAQEP